MTDSSPAAAQEQQASSLLPPRGPMRSMVMVVAVLGVILVLGLITLIGAVVVRVAKGAPKEAADAGPLLSESLTLPRSGKIRRVWTDGDRLIIHTADPAGRGEVLVYDLRKGRVLARIGVK